MIKPLIKTIDWEGNARQIARQFLLEPYLFVLESSQHDSERGRYSIIGFDPFDMFRHKGEDTLKLLKEKVCPFKNIMEDLNLPLSAGIVGYLSYDYGLYHEPIKLGTSDDLNLPDCCFGFYDRLIVIDHCEGKLHIVSTGLPEKNELLRQKRARERLDYIEEKMQISNENSSRVDVNFVEENFFDHGASNLSREEYDFAVHKALDYISAGEIYQVNFSQRFCWDVPFEGISAFDIYDVLSEISPTPFGCFYELGDHSVISNSPERFLKINGRNIQTRPMKGTRPRGFNTENDNAMRIEIQSSLKEQAELLMITDLERNDFGRVCDFGSIKVKDIREIEEYKTVFQATSTVEGVLREEVDAFDALAACFPGGSITGCPKIRAMEIIEELEPTRRGIYTGSFGYLSFNGNLDFNILIRTLLYKDKKVYFQTGGGIVADSDPAKEYEETLVKVKAIRMSINAVLQKYHKV